MQDLHSAEAVAPTRFYTMGDALKGVNRDVVFQICQWGVGIDVAEKYAKPSLTGVLFTLLCLGC